jgi:hypothetical protein
MNLSRGLLELLALEALSLPFLIELLLVLAYWTGFRLRLNAYWEKEKEEGQCPSYHSGMSVRPFQETASGLGPKLAMPLF